MKDRLTRLLARIEGLAAVQLVIGPAGVHLDFGHFRNAQAPHIECTILANTLISIYSKEKNCLLKSGPFPPLSLKADLEAMIIGQTVVRSQLDEAKNAARIIFEKEILLSFVPLEGNDRVYWAIYHWPEGHDAGIMKESFEVTATYIKGSSDFPCPGTS